MYAVVSTGGKQLKVEKGTVAVVEKLDAAPGESVTLDVLFVADGDSIVTDADALASATVKAEIVEHFLGDKQMIFKFKKRKGYKRTKGHRQQQTRVRITDISAVGGTKKAAAKPAAKPAKAEPKAEKVAEPKAQTKPAEKPAKAAAKAEPKPAKAEAKAPKAKVEAPKAEAAAKPKLDPEHCQALKADGTQCQNKPKEGSKYCGVHAKKYDK